MNVMTRTRGIDASDALVRYCERRFTFALDRFRTVARVGVRLDEIGPRVARCLAIAHVDGHPPIVVRVADGDAYGDAYGVVDLAAAKLAAAVARTLSRTLRERVVAPLRESRRSRRRARVSGS